MPNVYTPGPWWMARNSNGYVAGAGNFELTKALSRPDARLIAHAPDMLGALRQIADGAERRLRKGLDEGDAATLRIAREAIRHATGE